MDKDRQGSARKHFIAEIWNWSTEGVWAWIGTASLIVGLVLALFQYLYPTLSLSISPRMSALLNAAIPLGARASIFFFRFLFAPYFVWKKERITNEEWEELFKPKFVLACGSDVAGSKKTCEDGCDFKQAFRVVVRSLGFNPIVNCQGCLTSISRNGVLIWGNDSAVLTFAKADQGDSTHKTISLGLPQYLEIIGILPTHLKRGEIVNSVLFAVNTHARKFDSTITDLMRNNFGEYILTITITGHSVVPVGAKLRFNWTGDYTTSTLTLIDQFSMAITPPLSTPKPA